MSRRFHLVYVVTKEDIIWCERLEQHLRPLQRRGLLTTWFSQQMSAGTDEQEEWTEQLAAASIILLLISPDSIASDECMHILQRAQALHKQILPVLIRPAPWHLLSISHLPPLPQNAKPLSLWSNRDAGLLEVANAIQHRIDPHHMMTQTLSSAVSVSITQRQRFLALLRNRYTEVLKQSLQGSTPIHVRLQTNQDALPSPTDRIFRHVHLSNREIPVESSILQVYDEVGGELLILGEPGVGKSILLLHLAQDLLTRAEGNEHALPPVILNVSSWAEKRQPIAEWLVEELWVSYHISHKVGSNWVKKEQFLPFLDGLDEVPSSAQSACIDAINEYRKKYLVPPVICSRTADYFLQQHRLELECAIVVQPLTQEQVDAYLIASNPSFAEIHDALQENDILRELVTLPLMLNIINHSYQNASVDALPQSGSQEEQQRHIFDQYIQRMLPSNGRDQRTASQRTPKWLMWLACQMKQHNQATFYVEQLQRSWLSQKRYMQLYEQLAVRLFGFIAGVSVSVPLFFLFSFPSLSGSLLLLYILLGGMLGGVVSQENISASSIKQEQKGPRFFWQAFLIVLLVGTVAGQFYYVGLSASAKFTNAECIYIAFGYGLGCGLSAGAGSICLRVLLRKVHTATVPLWSRFIRSKEILNGILIGVVFWLTFGLGTLFGSELATLFIGLSFVFSQKVGLMPLLEAFLGVMWQGLPVALNASLGRGLYFAITYGVIGSLLSALLRGKSSHIHPVDRLVWSWKGFRKSLFLKQHIQVTLLDSLFVALGCGLSALFIGSGISIEDGLNVGLITFLSFGLSYWLLLGLFQGVSSETIDTQQKVRANQGIWNSLSNGLLLGVVSMIIVTVISFFCYVLNSDMSMWIVFVRVYIPSKGLDLHSLPSWVILDLESPLGSGVIAGLAIGVSIGLLVGLLHGGLAFLRHFLLRFLLWQEGVLPWKLSQNLDEATRSILLYKVGGGYRFIHSQFRDYIASLEKDQLLIEEQPLE